MTISLLINMKMPTFVGVFIFISRENYMLRWAERKKKKKKKKKKDFYNLWVNCPKGTSTISILWWSQRAETYLLTYTPTGLWSPCASAQSEQSLRCPYDEILRPWLSKMRPEKILIRLHECVGWSKSMLSAQTWPGSTLFFTVPFIGCYMQV